MFENAVKFYRPTFASIKNRHFYDPVVLPTFCENADEML